MNCGPTIITKRINKLKDDKGCTAKEIAFNIFVNVKTVQNWLKGKSEPTPQNIIKLAHYFDTHYDYIAGNSNRVEADKLPKSFKFVAFMEMATNKFYSADCISKAPTNKFFSCYITSNFNEFVYVTDNKIRFHLPNYYKGKED